MFGSVKVSIAESYELLSRSQHVFGVVNLRTSGEFLLAIIDKYSRGGIFS